VSGPESGLATRQSSPHWPQLTLAESFADAARGGLVRVVAGPWVSAYVSELEAFPRGTHKDQVDLSSGAFIKLARGPLVFSV
jgi:phage terminase large subunit-like protein